MIHDLFDEVIKQVLKRRKSQLEAGKPLDEISIGEPIKLDRTLRIYGIPVLIRISVSDCRPKFRSPER